MRELSSLAMQHCKGLSVEVIAIENLFFGPEITVSGLLTGQDILSQTKDRLLGDALLFPQAALRQGEDVFLDDMTSAELSQALGVPAIPVSGEGEALLNALLGTM